MATTATTNAFLTWFSQWGQVIYITVQMLFWVAIAVAAIMVALEYKRLVTFKVGEAKSAGSTKGKKAESHLESFVE